MSAVDGRPPSPRNWHAARTAWEVCRSITPWPLSHRSPAVRRRHKSSSVISCVRRLPRYDSDRNQPEQEVTSGLSPYLHFGHISAHQVFTEVMQSDDWNPGKIAEKATGSASDWWGASPPVESFLDELITWREVGSTCAGNVTTMISTNPCLHGLRKTLAEHANDPREYIYTLEQFEAAETHDELWNAAQRQLVREGRIHNYLRMVWGKKILEWSASPNEALEVLIELNNKYALDGRDPTATVASSGAWGGTIVLGVRSDRSSAKCGT